MIIKPLKIGQHYFASNLIQGPLAGYTCAPMRLQTWRWSNPAYCSTEMISATHLVYAKNPPQRYLQRDASEQALCVQLSAEDPEILAQAVQKIASMQPEIIELNCGCPVNKIRRKGAGSKLLSDPERLQRLIHALRSNTQSAISVKIRVSGDANDQDDLLLAKMIEQEGADALVVHGRHWSENYERSCRQDQIKRLVQAVKIPVIGNGDVKDVQSLTPMLNNTGCAGVMIARASMGQPWLFAELQSTIEQKPFTKPDPKTIGAIFIDHIQRLALLDNPHRAILQARKMGKYYARNNIATPQVFQQQLMQCTSLENFIQIIHSHF